MLLCFVFFDTEAVEEGCNCVLQLLSSPYNFL